MLAVVSTQDGPALLPAVPVAEHGTVTSVPSRRGDRALSVLDGARLALGRLTEQGKFAVTDRPAVERLLLQNPDAADALIAGRQALLDRLPGATFVLEADAEPGTPARGLVAYAETDVPAEQAVSALLSFYEAWAVQPAPVHRSVAFDLRPR